MHLYLSVETESKEFAAALTLFLTKNKIEFSKIRSESEFEEEFSYLFDIDPQTTSELFAVAGLLHAIMPGGISE